MQINSQIPTYWINIYQIKQLKMALLMVTIFIIGSCSNDNMITEDEMLVIEDQMPVEDPVEDPVQDPVVSEPVNYTYLALGDSYTIGQGVTKPMRWPNQLKSRLKSDNINLEEVNILARTGWTTTALLSAIAREKPKNHNLVSLLIGVNNQYQNSSFTSFKNEFDELLNISLSLAGKTKKVFVVSIPDYGVTPFGAGFRRQTLADEIDMYNAYIKEKCDQFDVPFIDVTYLSRQLGDSKGALADDELHPSGSQYSKWVDLIYPVALDLLKKSGS